MTDQIQISNYAYILIESIQNIFHPNIRYYSLKYIENGTENISVKFDIRTLTSLMTSLFAIQSFIQQDENFENSILIYPDCKSSISIHRYKNEDNVTISIEGQGGFKMDNGYVGRIFSGIEDIFLDSTIPNNDYFL